MGFQLGRSLSVLVLAGVALVGCNNTPEKRKDFGTGPSLPGTGGLASQGTGQQPRQLNPQPGGQFPQVQKPAPFGGYQPTNTAPIGGAPAGSGRPSESFMPGPGAGPLLPGQLPPNNFPPMTTGTPARPGYDARTTVPPTTDFATTPFPGAAPISVPPAPKEFR